MGDIPILELDAVDALFDLDSSAFVGARDELARALRAEDRRDQAAAVKALRRPTAVAAAVNHVVRSDPSAVDELVAATHEVRAAQESTLRGDPADLRAATSRRRALVTGLARRVAALAGPTHLDEAIATLEAASLDPAATALLRAGHLTRELGNAGGFGLDDADLDWLPTPPPEAEPEPDPEEQARAAEAARAHQAAVESAQTRVTEARAALAEAEHALAALDP